MLNCTVSDPTQLGVLEGASGAVLGALEGHYVFMCWAPSFLRSARARVTRIPESRRGRKSSHALQPKTNILITFLGTEPSRSGSGAEVGKDGQMYTSWWS